MLGKENLPTKGIIDSQSVKNTDCASLKDKGYDGGKKTGGIKRHLLTDTDGLPLAIRITAANESERDNCHQILIDNENDLIERLDTVYADSGYTGKDFHFEVYQDTGIIMEVIPRNKEKERKENSFAVVSKRWVVERSFAWLEKCHRLWKNTERLVKTSKTMVELCFVRLLVKRLSKIG